MMSMSRMMTTLEHEPSSTGQKTAPTSEDNSASSSNSVTCDQVPSSSSSVLQESVIPTDSHHSVVTSWCYCKQDEDFDYMIACDNQNCPIEWYHLSCVHLSLDNIPDGDWFCPEHSSN